MTAEQLHGNDGTTETLVTIWGDGTAEVATRPLGGSQSWGAPTTVRLIAQEPTC